MSRLYSHPREYRKKILGNYLCLGFVPGGSLPFSHPAAKGVRQKESSKKVTKKVTKASEKVTESVPKTKKSDRTPFAALLLRHPDFPHHRRTCWICICHRDARPTWGRCSRPAGGMIPSCPPSATALSVPMTLLPRWACRSFTGLAPRIFFIFAPLLMEEGGGGGAEGRGNFSKITEEKGEKRGRGGVDTVSRFRFLRINFRKLPDTYCICVSCVTLPGWGPCPCRIIFYYRYPI